MSKVNTITVAQLSSGAENLMTMEFESKPTGYMSRALAAIVVLWPYAPVAVRTQLVNSKLTFGKLIEAIQIIDLDETVQAAVNGRLTSSGNDLASELKGESPDTIRALLAELKARRSQSESEAAATAPAETVTA